MQHPKLIAAIVLLAGWSWFARPLYDAALIAAGRVLDQQWERRTKPLVQQPRGTVVDLNTAAAVEIADYLRRLRDGKVGATQEWKESLPTMTAPGAAREQTLQCLRTSLAYPPPGLDLVGDAVERDEPVGEDELTVVHRLTIPVLPGVHTVGLYLLPKKRLAGKRLPLIIAAYGRGGMPDDPPDHQLPVLTHTNRDLARWALEDGYAVWLPVFVFYGKGLPDDLRERLTVRAWEVGTTLPAIEIAKTIKAIEVLSQRPEIDPARVAMVGHSYGGFNTLITTALEPRIRVAVVSAYVNDREEVLDSSEPDGFLDWRFPNSLGKLRDPALAALICPRPLLVIAGDQDQLFPVAGARVTAQVIHSIYEKAGVAGSFAYGEFIGRHDFNGTEASRFVKATLGEP